MAEEILCEDEIAVVDRADPDEEHVGARPTGKSGGLGIEPGDAGRPPAPAPRPPRGGGRPGAPPFPGPPTWRIGPTHEGQPDSQPQASMSSIPARTRWSCRRNMRAASPTPPGARS